MLPSPPDSVNMSDVQGKPFVLDPRSQEPLPAQDNTWFDSRVMSRDHAELSIAPEVRNIYICDYGSTHGTWINNTKLITGEKTPLIHGDVLTFGVPVDREDETYPALAVKCKFHWVDKRPVSDEIPVKSNVIECITPPVSKLRPSTSTNTFCVPDDDSDIGEILVPKVRFPFTQWPRISAHPLEPICVDEDEQPLSQTIQKEQHMEEDLLKYSELEDSDYEEVLEDGSNDSTNSEEESDLGESVSSLLIKSNDCANMSADTSADADVAELDATHYDSAFPCFDGAHDSFQPTHDIDSDPDSDSDSDVESESESASNSDALSDKESSAGNGSYNGDSDDDDDDDEDEVYINTNINPTPFVDPDVLSLDELHSVNTAPHVKPETLEPKPSDPLGSPPAYHFPGPSFQSGPSYLPAPSCYETNPWRMPQCFPPPPHTPYPRFEYADGPFSCKFGSTYQRDFDSRPTPPHREPTPLPSLPKELSSDPDSVSLKRKASEMVTQDAEQQDAQEAEVIVSASQPDLDSIPRAEVVDAITSALAESEPSPKRAKTSHSSSNVVATYTATAVISALLGGLGTIVLLAALPAEYFQ
ncbi:Vacuolar protein sorting-associated protein 64 [Penicillium maclennaniae]|uniref:Vacuolar protein sorting-associated protein 64 n=1 Tax=Penicillium maclennaniae TaxID=1343394 RepID=UPI0025414798|nr:Vacuolar protein sorting-associated protein 64 [Penicillium maclennaniae]KAJ5683985.1 Vacuolar protein sorting-associated protein 64 [Penicillium maclennaniae]